MKAWQHYQRRRWVRRYALAIVRHSGIGWNEALAMANAALDGCPGALRCLHPTDAALIELGIQEADLL